MNLGMVGRWHWTEEQKKKRSEACKGEKNHTWKGGPTKYVCRICGKDFYGYGGRKHCSKKCLWQSMTFVRGKDHREWESILKKCSYCNKEIYVSPCFLKYKNHFCNKKCMDLYAIGKHPSKETRVKLSIAHAGRMPKNTQGIRGGCFGNIKAGHYLIPNRGQMFFRSKWEVDYALYSEFLKSQGNIKEWEYEKDVFVFHKIQFGTRSYRPDFKIYNLDGTIEYHEVKGWMDKKSVTKLKRMAKYYPKIKIVLIRAAEIKEINKCKKLWQQE